jgi:hypothetical protein
MLQTYVSSVSDVSKICCKCFVQMLQKYRDVAYVAMVINICCKRLFPMFHLFFRRMLQVCLSECCICFIHMLLVFYLHVAYVCNDFQVF